MTRPRQKTDPPKGPELVFAVVRPVGTPDSGFNDALSSGLQSYGYAPHAIKLSGVLRDAAFDRGSPLPAGTEAERINGLIDEGDALCERLDLPSAVALLGVNEIREARKAAHEAASRTGEGLENEPVPRAAYVMDSLKRLPEVTGLRSIYGDRLMVVGLQASLDARRKELANKIRPAKASMPEPELASLVNALIERDLRETGKYGQNTLKAFPLADVFVDVEKDPDGQVRRLLKLLFGDPDYEVPTVMEYGMNLAQAASTRSPELGRKVGAAILREDFTVVSLGTNAHPVATGSPAYDASVTDITELLVDTLRLAGTELSDEARGRLQADPDRYAKELLAGPLDSGEFRALTEFQRTVHAEMAAVLDALNRGTSVEGSTVFVTAFPCHNCTKHLLAAGLPVRYLEPYPKSRAFAMYGTDVAGSFLPFTGIAPRRYDQLFHVAEDSKNADGSRPQWGAAERRAAYPKLDPFTENGMTDRETAAVAVLPDWPMHPKPEAGAGPDVPAVGPALQDSPDGPDLNPTGQPARQDGLPRTSTAGTTATEHDI